MLLLATALILSACHGAIDQQRRPPREASTPTLRTGVSPAEAGREAHNKSTDPDPFSSFRSAVSKYFAPVAAQFDLGAGVETQLGPEMDIEFKGANGQLVIAYESGSRAWVTVGVTTAAGHERRFGLHTIVEYREGSKRSLDALKKLDGMDAEVRLLADLASKHAGSLLKERTADLRELFLLSQRSLRERERTELGGDRTLDPRPALSELFQACEPETHAICAYHAVVEYNYSPDDVAAFLGVDREAIQRTLNAQDTIR